MISNWPCTMPDGSTSEELLVRQGEGSGDSLLIIPPLFDEHNKMRRQIALIMRRFAEDQVDTQLPDLPGWNESLQPLRSQSLAFWRAAIAEAARFLDVTGIVAIRSGALLAPEGFRGWLYEPQSGARLLRGMIRGRIIANKEAGSPQTSDEISAHGRNEGVTLAGWPIGAEMFRELESAEISPSEGHTIIEQSLIGGQALWLRAEAGEDAAQANALVERVLKDLVAAK